jgi:hypothetical protein
MCVLAITGLAMKLAMAGIRRQLQGVMMSMLEEPDKVEGKEWLQKARHSINDSIDLPPFITPKRRKLTPALAGPWFDSEE